MSSVLTYFDFKCNQKWFKEMKRYIRTITSKWGRITLYIYLLTYLYLLLDNRDEILANLDLSWISDEWHQDILWNSKYGNVTLGKSSTFLEIDLKIFFTCVMSSNNFSFSIHQKVAWWWRFWRFMTFSVDQWHSLCRVFETTIVTRNQLISEMGYIGYKFRK